jgi:hypothetical protein
MSRRAPVRTGGSPADGGAAGSSSVSGLGGESGASSAGESGQGVSDGEATCFPLEARTRRSRVGPSNSLDRAALGSSVDQAYVATGTYPESLELRDGITFEGGVSAFGAPGDLQWTLACSHEDRVVISGAERSDQTVLAEDLSGEARLSSLTIQAMAGAERSTFG